MHSATLFFIIAFVATLALAAPVTSSHDLVKRSFRVQRTGRPKPSVRDAMKQAYRKYGWEVTVWDSSSSSSDLQDTSSSVEGSAGTEEGEVQAIPDESHGAYISPVMIGNQQLNLDFDTGSSDLWVFSTALTAAEGRGHTLYNPAQSQSFVNYPGGSWETQYGDGSRAAGSVGFDTVTIGGATVEKQCVELADRTLGFQDFVKSDGLLGLGFSNINTVRPQKQKTFWENILPQLDLPVFTADLDETASGSYEFGSIDTSKYTGDLHWAPVDSESGYWLVESRFNVIGGRPRNCRMCSPAVMDTGTTLMMVDEDVADAYYSQVQGAHKADGLWAYPCSTVLPDFGVAIGNNMATIRGSDLTFNQLRDTCYGGIQAMTAGTGLQIYGDIFFKQFFTVFDGGNLQVGVAPKA